MTPFFTFIKIIGLNWSFTFWKNCVAVNTGFAIAIIYGRRLAIRPNKPGK